MTQEEIAVKLEGFDHEIKSLKHRMSEAEKTTKTIHDLAKSVAVLAEQMKTMNQTLNALNEKVEKLEAEPAKKWRFVVEKAIYFVVAAVVGYMLAGMGLNV